jgi:hypothetical protein
MIDYQGTLFSRTDVGTASGAFSEAGVGEDDRET